jgi:hypothetical protein
MSEEKMQYGLMEAFSFRKGVVRISGRWIRFGPEAENYIRGLSIGDAVGYLVGANGSLKWIEPGKAGQRAAASIAVAATVKAPVKAQAVPPAPAAATPRPAVLPMPRMPTFEDRNRSIERQVALKAAVELAGLYGYKSTRECLDVAASFAAWIEADPVVDVQLPRNGAVEEARGPSPRPSGSQG